MALLDARALGCILKVFRALVCSHKVLHPDVLSLATLAYPAYLVMPTVDLWPPGHLIQLSELELLEEWECPPRGDLEKRTSDIDGYKAYPLHTGRVCGCWQSRLGLNPSWGAGNWGSLFGCVPCYLELTETLPNVS